MREINTGGVVLIALGLFFLGLQLHWFGGEAVVLLIGLSFLIPYFAGGRRQLGLLVPGSLLTCLGAGVVIAARSFWPPANSMVIMLALSAGFAGISVLTPERPAWPLVPAGFFAVIAALAGISAFPRLRFIRDVIFGLVLIGIGVTLIIRSRRAA